MLLFVTGTAATAIVSNIKDSCPDIISSYFPWSWIRTHDPFCSPEEGGRGTSMATMNQSKYFVNLLISSADFFFKTLTCNFSTFYHFRLLGLYLMNSRNKTSIVDSKVSVKPCASFFGMEKKYNIILS
jgi:hypothetical protein